MVTLRFTWRDGTIRILVPVTGGKVRQYMNKQITYSDEPIGDVRIVKDFLPAPEELVFREDSVKVTISLSKKSVDFFKSEADRHHTQYQRMIRNLLDAYVDTQKPSGGTTRRSLTA